MTQIKICGLRDRAGLDAAQDAGADFAGFVFYEKSPRYISLDDAKPLVASAKIQTVGLFVDPADDYLRKAVNMLPLSMIQLHGNETPARVGDIKLLTGLPVMKAMRVAQPDDLMFVNGFAQVSDWLLFDSRVSGAALPGGTGRHFDWSILKGYPIRKPWMLAGGLTAQNVGEALRILKPHAVDVSSGVESERGIKDAGKIAEFVNSVRAC